MTKEQILQKYIPYLNAPVSRAQLSKALDEWVQVAHLPVIEALRICINSIKELRRGQVFTFHEDVLKECEAAIASYAEQAPANPNEHPDQALFDQYSEIKAKIGELGYLSFISSKEVEEYREWLRNDKYKHRLEWFEKEYPNGLYSKDEDGNLFGVNIMTKKFLAEADAAWEAQVTGKSAGEGDGMIEESDSKNTSKIKESVAAKIDAQIRSLGLNKLEFSRLMGVHPSTITKWLSGSHNFELRTLCEIEKKLNISLINYRIESSGEAGKLPEQQPADPWISIEKHKPMFGQLCDIWIKAHENEAAHRRTDYQFVSEVGVNEEPAFQPPYMKEAGLYEMAFYLSENLVTHWMPRPSAPGSVQSDVSGEQKGGEV